MSPVLMTVDMMGCGCQCLHARHALQVSPGVGSASRTGGSVGAHPIGVAHVCKELLAHLLMAAMGSACSVTAGTHLLTVADIDEDLSP